MLHLVKQCYDLYLPEDSSSGIYIWTVTWKRIRYLRYSNWISIRCVIHMDILVPALHPLYHGERASSCWHTLHLYPLVAQGDSGCITAVQMSLAKRLHAEVPVARAHP